MKENKDHHQVVISVEHYESLIAAADGIKPLGLHEVRKIDRHARKFNYWRRIKREQEVLAELVAKRAEKDRAREFIREWEGKEVVFTIRGSDGVLRGQKVIVLGPSRQVKTAICARYSDNRHRRCVHAITSCFMTIEAFNDYNRQRFDEEEAKRRATSTYIPL